MTTQRFSRLSSRTLAHSSTAALLAAVCASGPVRAFAQVPSNRTFLTREPFSTCMRNSPARTSLTLSTRAKDTLRTARATTDQDFFGPSDTGQWIGLTAAKANGWAQVKSFIDSRNVDVLITESFDLPATRRAAPGTWARWPFCYMTVTDEKYGFHFGVGHQKDGATNLTLDFDDQQYSVDRCSLAHDKYYWGDACNNDHWVAFCFTKVQVRTSEEEYAMWLAKKIWNEKRFGRNLGLGAPRILSMWEGQNGCSPKRAWIELPTNPRDIPGAAAACYGKAGQVIYGLRGFALDVSGWNHENGAKAILWHPNGGCNQKWRVLKVSTDPRYGFELRGLGGKCLGTPARIRPNPGQPVQMWDCNGRGRQLWTYEHGQIRVLDKTKPRLCLDVPNDRTPGDVIVAKCASINKTTNPSQQWRLSMP
jgi:Ricin-type beta-trefoil lectin domain